MKMLLLLSAITAVLNFSFSVIAARNLPVAEFSRFLSMWSIVSIISFVGGITQIVIAASTLDVNNYDRKKKEVAEYGKDDTKNDRKFGKMSFIILAHFSVFLMVNTIFSSFQDKFIFFTILTFYMQTYCSFELGFLQSQLNAIRWGLFNLVLAFIKTMTLFCVSIYSQSALLICTSIIFINTLIIHLAGKSRKTKMNFENILTLLKPENHRIFCLLAFWLFVYFDILFARFNFTDKGAADYALTSNVVKSLFALNLLDIWGQIRKNIDITKQRKSIFMGNIFIRETVKVLLATILLLLWGEGIYSRLFGKQYEFMNSEIIILLLGNIFWGLAYVGLVRFKTSYSTSFGFLSLGVISLISYFILCIELSAKVEYVYLSSSILFSILTILTVRDSTIANPINILYRRK